MLLLNPSHYIWGGFPPITKSKAKFLNFFFQHTYGLKNQPLLNREEFFFIPSSTIWNESEPITKKFLFPPVQNTYGTHMI